MDYTLAKELKEAGFRFYALSNDVVDILRLEPRPEGTVDARNQTGRYIILDSVWVRVPTLEELIEACGDNLQSLYRADKDNWEAVMEDDKFGEPKGFESGSTPTEAVARLYVALHG